MLKLNAVITRLQRLQEILNLIKIFGLKPRNKANTSSYYRKYRILSVQENSLIFLQTINFVKISKHIQVDKVLQWEHAKQKLLKHIQVYLCLFWNN